MRETAPPDLEPAGVYVHIPFCVTRCSYCDFAVVVGDESALDAYRSCLGAEIRTWQRDVPRVVDSIYFGGGTPSRLTPDAVRAVLDAVASAFDVARDAEISLEANPEDIDAARLRGYRDAGVNRITLGIQTLDDAVLRRTGRRHDAATATGAVQAARRAGFRSVGCDLIVGLPGERLDRWYETVDAVIALEPDHVSCYLLETDKDSALARSIRRGTTAPPDDDVLAATWMRTVERFDSAGLRPYEISNFARDGHISRHNEKYWTDHPFAGFGLGAHGYAAGARRANTKDLSAYLRAVERGVDPVDEYDPWHPVRRVEEALFMGLRRVDGIDLSALSQRYAVDLDRALRSTWERYGQRGDLVADGSRLRLTRSGLLGSNALFSDILGQLEAP